MDWLLSHVTIILFILTFIAYSLPNKNFLYSFPRTVQEYSCQIQLWMWLLLLDLSNLQEVSRRHK